MIMGGEPVIEYAIQLKGIFGHQIFVMGYANDIMGYIPSESILEEGEYEGEISQMVYGLPAKWETGIQERILDEFRKLSIRAGIEADK
jgi:neutral ceramidase